jgi:hypothetical protein
MQPDSIEELSKMQGTERQKILVVGSEGVFTDDLINYAIQLAQRIGHDLLALTVWTSPEKGTGARLSAKAAEAFRERAGASGVRCEHLSRFGDTATAVEDLIHDIKRIELLVADSRAGIKEISREIAVPIYTVSPNLPPEKGARAMSKESGLEHKKPWIQTAGFGLAAVALYAAVFTNSATVMSYFTRGGWYAALPIATVFLFSFVHGSFASNLWSLLGIEAMRKDALRETERKVAQKRKPARKRPRAYAYVNPFHKI